jgi:acyl transferase domain-containing protein
MAITGGATVISTPWLYVECGRQALFPLSRQGQCKSFAADADGTVFSEGVGVLVLERVSDALRLGHHVLGVIRGSAINQDGASNGLTAPNGVAHERVIRQALVSAGVSTAEVDAVEAHGMGTLLGDPIEAQALLATYGRDREENRPLWLGSLKSNIGNTQAASAMAGIIKMVMSMRHGRLPKTLHVEYPSQNVDWDNGAVSLLTESMPWLKAGRARLAAVHSFGWSGTNAHIILEEPAGADSYTEDGGNASSIARVATYSKGDGTTSDTPVAWPVSGRGEDGLRRQAGRLGEFVRDNPKVSMIDIGYSLSSSRDQLSHRCVVIGTNRDDMREALEHVSDGRPPSMVVTGRSSPGRDDVVFLFAGDQWQGAPVELANSSPAFASAIDRIETILGSLVDWSLHDALRGDTGVYAQSDVAVIADFAIQTAVLAAWQACGVRPSAVVGHESSEIVAAYAAGCMTLSDAVNIVVAHSRDESLNAELATTSIPFWSTATGNTYSGAAISSQSWLSSRADEPSNMADVTQALLGQGYRAFVEVTPSTIVSDALRDAAIVVPGAGARGRGLEDMFVSLAQLWVSGVEVDWASVTRHDGVEEIPLPTYMFAQRRYWLDQSPLWGADGIMMEKGDALRDSLATTSELDKVN